MTTTTTSTCVDRVLAKLQKVKHLGRGWTAICPAHDDHNPSLSIAEGDDGRVLIKCMAGCETSAVVSALGLTMKDLMVSHNGGRAPRRNKAATETTRTIHPTPERAAQAALWSLNKDRDGAPMEQTGTWTYRDITGREYARVLRFDATDRSGKSYRPIHANGDGWAVGDPPNGWQPYRVDELPVDGVIWWVEGEKSADALWSIGIPATTTAHGCKSPQLTDYCAIADREVIAWPDNHHPGRDYVESIAARLAELSPPAGVRIIEPPDELPDGGDAADYAAARECIEADEIRSGVEELGVQAQTWTPTPATLCDDSDDELCTRALLCTDVGNAARYAMQHRDTLRWCGPWQTWLVWSGKRWERDESEAAMSRAIQTALSILDEAKQAPSDEQRQRLAEHGARTQRRDRLNAMIALAKNDMAVSPHDLDTDPFAFNVLNGTLDLRTGELRPHNPADLITQLAPVEFQATADAPVLLSLLDRIFTGDAGLIGFIQRWLGYCLTGDTREQVLPVPYGVGANGKSTLIDAIGGVMGDYFGVTTAELFTESRTGANEQRYELAELCGKRLVVASESERGRRLRIALIKGLTGDELIKCRPIYGRPFAYRRKFKAMLVTNHKPRIDDDTEAVWRRVRLIPFDVVIPKAERDTLLPMKLRAEASGILAWMVRGCLDWQRLGLGEPAAVMTATQTYREESDLLAGFIAECCTLIPDAWTRTADLRRAYEQFASEQGDKPIGSNHFADSLRRNGCKPDKLNHSRGWRGIGLLTDGGATP